MLFIYLPLLLAANTVGATYHRREAATDACSQIAKSISSSSAIFYPDSLGYATDIDHWTTSSILNATCSVEPGTAEDVAIVVCASLL